MNKKESESTIDLTELLNSPQEMSPATYQYYRNLQKRKIIINDQITSDVVEEVIIPLLEMDRDGSKEPIEIVISSVGGSVFDGLVLCDIIDRLNTPTKITVLGYAYSLGGIVLMAGFNNSNVKRVCYPFSTALLHSGHSYLEGSAFEVRDAMDFNNKFEEKLKKYILTHSNISAEEYEKMERHEWYMDSATMLEKGLVDEIL